MAKSKRRFKVEPPLGSVIIDASGSAWQRHPVGWAIAGSDMSWSYTWVDLNKELFNVQNSNPTEEWLPAMNDPRLPIIVYVPHEELLVKNS